MNSQETSSALEGNSAPQKTSQKNEKTEIDDDDKTKTEKRQQANQNSKKEIENLPLIIGGLLLIAILLGGGLFVLMMNKPAPYVAPPIINGNTTANTSQNQTPIIPEPQCGDECNLEKATESGNAIFCGFITNTSVVQKCYDTLSSTSLEACRLVTNNSLLNECITRFARTKDDTSICSALPSAQRDACVAQSDSCLRSSTPALCSALKTNEPTRCGSDQTCLLSYGMNKQDSTACQLITTPAATRACLSIIAGKDSCNDYLPTGAERDYCHSIYGINTNSSLACYLINTNSPYAVECYGTLAARAGNISICDTFILEDKWTCYRGYALYSGDLMGCKLISRWAPTSIFLCAFDYAKKYGDPSACELTVETLANRFVCYQGSIWYDNQKLQTSKCAGVSSIEYRNRCYLEAARLNKDVGICDRAWPESAIEVCREGYRVNQTITTAVGAIPQ